MDAKNLKHRTAFAFAIGLLTLAAHSQPVPSDAEVAAQRKRIMETMAATQGVGNPGQPIPNGAAGGSLKAVEGFLAPVNATAKPIDLQTLSRQGALPKGQPQQPTSAERKGSDLMIFASLSMPEAMLMNYAAQAKRFGAVLLLRGFVDDKLSTTKEVLLRLNKSGAEFDISPEPFKYFKITKVPTVVLASANASSVVENGCARPETYVSISGDITLVDALDKFSLLSKSGLAKDAKARINADRQAQKEG